MSKKEIIGLVKAKNNNLMKEKNSAQTLIIILFVLIVFTAIIVTIASLTARELELRELDDISLKTNYMAETGWERAMYYLKNNNPTSQITIKPKCEGPTCIDECPDSKNCNSLPTPNCDCDKNPTQEGYFYSATITPNGTLRPNGEICNSRYCIDTTGSTPGEF